jgi:hypothetical protein
VANSRTIDYRVLRFRGATTIVSRLVRVLVILHVVSRTLQKLRHVDCTHMGIHSSTALR